MRFMVLVKASEDSENGIMPSTEEFAQMGAYNEQLAEAGVILAGDGLKPTSAGKRVRFDGTDRVVIDGPFAETKELVAGYWIWEVASMEEALEWLKKAPFGGGMEIELRPFYEVEDFGAEFTAEVHAREDELRSKIGQD